MPAPLKHAHVLVGVYLFRHSDTTRILDTALGR
uniref:Uncharacterized protein n=1 Tax=Siphoviridae sp. cthHz3 TaxID=2825614 RepID=A0A8S5UYH9_9CAUD|nr:MAG TPA: hypothetical protein [Siphoviridae sp. cthHz3]